MSRPRSSVHPSRESGPAQRLPQKLHAVSHLQGSIGVNCLWASVLHLCLFSASVTQVCPKVTASLLFHTSALQRFHRQALPLENGRNLVTTSLNSDIVPCVNLFYSFCFLHLPKRKKNAWKSFRFFVLFYCSTCLSPWQYFTINHNSSVTFLSIWEDKSHPFSALTLFLFRVILEIWDFFFLLYKFYPLLSSIEIQLGFWCKVVCAFYFSHYPVGLWEKSQIIFLFLS